MFEEFDKLIKKIGKLPQYYILRQEKNAAIIGIKMKINHHIDLNGTYSLYRKNMSVDMPTFFLMTSKDKTFAAGNDLLKDFIERDLPVLYIHKNDLKKSGQEIHDILDKTINDTYFS